MSEQDDDDAMLEMSGDAWSILAFGITIFLMLVGLRILFWGFH